MKSKTSTGIMLTMLITTISTLAFNIRPVKGEGTRLYVDPTYVFAFSSETFTVDIKIADVFSLFAWQINMSFNPTVLQFVNVTEGEFLKDQPEGTLPPYQRIENELGWVLFTWVTKGKYEGVNGSGTLATVEFLAKGVGETVLNITHPLTYLLKWNPPPIPWEDEFEDIPCVKESSYFLSTESWMYDRFVALNSSYHSHLEDYLDLQGKFDNLESNYTSLNVTQASLLDNYTQLQADYISLKSEHDDLSVNYDDLRSEHDDLSVNYDDLRSEHDDLSVNYDDLRSEHDDLGVNYDDLRSKHENTTGELVTARYLSYVLVMTTIICVVSIAYLLLRKPRVKPT